MRGPTLLLILCISCCVLPNGFCQILGPRPLNLISAITPEKIWQEVARSTKASIPLPSENPCQEDLIFSFNHFMGNTSIFTYAGSTGLSINDLGDYMGCSKNNGRYFFYIVSAQMPLLMNGMCLPQSCSAENLLFIRILIADLISQALKYPITVSQVIFMDSQEMNQVYGGLKTGGVITYWLIGLMFLFCVVGTVCVALNTSKEGALGKAMKCFDLYSNLKNIMFGTNAVDPNLNILNGVRVLAMFWIIVGHTFEIITGLMAPIINLEEMFHNIINERPYAIYWGATVSVDVFFFMSAFLGVLVCDHQLKTSKSSKIATVLMLYLHRAIRIIPIYGLTILVFVYILPTLYNGPIYYTMAMGPFADYCRDHWYWNLSFLNNFFDVKEGCISWSWYLANDFQMYLIVPLLCILYSYKKVYACLTVIGLFIVSALSQIFVFVHYDISLNLFKGSYADLLFTYYVKPYCRINPFLIGIIFAWLYQTYKNPDKGLPIFHKINRLFTENNIARYIMFVVGAASMWCCVFLYFDFYEPNESKTMLETLAFAIFSRPGFVIGMMLVIYPAILGKGYILQSILGNELFGVMSKLTFVAYLFHPIVVAFYYLSTEQSIYFIGYKVVNHGIECVVLTYFVAFLLAGIVEYPLTLLSKEFLRPSRSIKAKPKPIETTESIVINKDS